jgi:hypothetical protein
MSVQKRLTGPHSRDGRAETPASGSRVRDIERAISHAIGTTSILTLHPKVAFLLQVSMIILSLTSGKLPVILFE